MAGDQCALARCDGNIAAIIHQVDRQTELHYAEKALRESEARHRLLIGSWAQAVWEADADGVIVADSPSWRASTGQTMEEWLGYGWLDAVHPDDRSFAERQWRETVAAHGLVNAEFRLRSPDGSWRWTNVRAAPVLDPRGRIEKWAGMNIDIHESKLAEEAREESERFSRALVEGMPQLVWRAAKSGEWTWASPQWTIFTGQAEPDSHGWGWLEALQPDDRDSAKAAWAGAIDRGALDAEYRICHAAEDRYCWFQTRATPVHDDDGQIFEWLGTSTDVDDLRRLQERQAVLVAELQHRTRNLIAVVRSLPERTMDEVDTLDRFHRRFGDRLEALSRVQGLLSRLSAGRRVSFAELIGSELDALGAPQNKITLNGPPDVPLRSGTVQTFALALHELTTNAVKYGALAAPDGHLTISWKTAASTTEGEQRLQVDWCESGVVMSQVGDRPRGGGYGRELIEQALPYQLGAKTTYDFGSDGVHCTIDVAVAA